jgi:hypothetical protein
MRYMTRCAVTFWASGFVWSRSALLMDGLPPQFDMGNMIALRAGRAFVIVSLPRRRSIQMDVAAKREEKEVDEHRKTPHTLSSLLLTNTTLRSKRQKTQHRIKFFKN